MDNNSMLVNNVGEMLNELEPPPSSECCIYRVPGKIRKVNEEAYTPHLVSIGPFHHDNEKLKSMDQVKKRYMKKLVLRNGNSILNSCIEFVKQQEGRIRDCYSERIKMNSDEFVKMILVDGCFIIELLLLNSDNTKWEDEDDKSIFLVPWRFGEINLDLIFLENQIPFFVLEGLFSLASAASFEACSLLYLSLDFFKESNKNNNNIESNFQSIKHFTDLVLTLYRPPTRRWPRLPNEIFQSVSSSTELNGVGVTFKASPCKCLFDIDFTDEVLCIPQFILDDNTETHIKNLMALELCRYTGNNCITDYIIFMDCLINTTRDVDLLVHKKIIVNCLGDNKAAADLFNNLCINVPFDEYNFYFSRVCRELNNYYEVRRHRLKAMLKRDYFHTPWNATSTIAAIMLLVLTFIQSVCSIISIIRRK